MAKQSKFKRGPAPVYPDLGYPAYGGYKRTPYPQKVRLSKDPRMMMEYRRPLFILAGATRRFSALVGRGNNAQALLAPTAMNYMATVGKALASGFSDLVSDTSGVTTINNVQGDSGIGLDKMGGILNMIVEAIKKDARGPL